MPSPLRLALSIPLLTAVACGSEPAAEPPEAPELNQPNILLVIADDWSYPHAGAYGDRAVETPTFDGLAREGMLFTNAYCASPSCSPSRASVLTGRYPHQNAELGNLWSIFPRGVAVYTERLADAGYFVGHDQKGWAPGDWSGEGWPHNPAGEEYADVEAFLAAKPDGQPFCYWYGTRDPHRPYEPNLGVLSGIHPDSVEVPGFLPDLPCVRNDLMDYYAEVERLDKRLGDLLDALRARGELDNTLVVVTSDNGMPFPRAKANLYDAGTRVPLVAVWPGHIPPGSVRTSFVNLASLGPTFLEAAGVPVPRAMTLPSILGGLTDPDLGGDTEVFLERERHAQVRADSGSYAMRGLRDADFLYVRNFYPDRWPAGDPVAVLSVGAYGDVDNSITKMLMLGGLGEGGERLRDLAFAKRPAEELFLVGDDPHQLRNLANDPAYAGQLAEYRSRLRGFMAETGDPRASDPRTAFWDEAEYTPAYRLRTYDREAYIAAYEWAELAGHTNFDRRACLP